MKTKLALGVLAVALLALNSCKKPKKNDPSGPNPPNGQPGSIYNKWEVISGLGNTKYVVIKSDTSIFMLDSAQYNFRKMDNGMIYHDSLALDDLYSYKISNDTLKLTSSNGTALLKLKPNAPDETAWVIFVNPIDSINSPRTDENIRVDMAFDGTNLLWTAYQGTDTVYKFNPNTHQLTGKIKLPYPAFSSITYGNGEIWISDGSTVRKINSAGTILSSSPVLSNQGLYAVAIINQELWFSASKGNISTWNMGNGAITFQLQAPQPQIFITGMEYVNGFLYLNDNEGGIYKCQISPFRVLTNYRMKEKREDGYGYNGLTYDGSKFWIAYKRKIRKLSI